MPSKNDFYSLFNATLHARAERFGRLYLTWAETRECLCAVYHVPRAWIPEIITDMEHFGLIHKSRYRIIPNGGMK